MSTSTSPSRAPKNSGQTHAERPAASAPSRGRSPYAGLLQRKCACGGSAGIGGSCEDCDKKRLQRKAAASESAARIANDDARYEQEADSVAERVLGMPTSAGATEGPRNFAPPGIQRRRIDDSGALDTVPAQVDSALSAPGRPLDPAVRQFFEPRFGHDFGRVRVHVDNAAAESVQAQAFTVGHRIVFAAHQYAPATTAGRRLLAHELTHVVQQGATGNTAAAASGTALSRKAATLLQRKPKPPYPGKVLSLAEIAKDPLREKLRDNTKQTKAKVCRSIGKAADTDNCPASLADGDKVTVIAEKVAGLWLQIENKSIPNFGPKEPCHVLGAFIEAQEPPAPAAAPKQEVTVPPSGAAAKIGDAELVSEKFADVKNDPQYLDNFSNDINEAWLPNDRVFVFQYPNGATLKIALQDLVRALDVKSELNPPPAISESLKRQLDAGEASGDLVVPRVKGDEPEGTYVYRDIEKSTAFYRDPGSKVIYPKRSKIPKIFLPRISHAVEQIEDVRVNQELWQKAAPKILEIVANMEWSAPQGFGSLLVSLGRGIKRAGRAAKGLVIKPGVPKVTAPHIETLVPHVSAPRAAEQELAESAPHSAPKPSGGVELPEPAFVGKGAKPQAGANEGALDVISDDTTKLFAAKPQLKEALEDAPRAAKALKKCRSPCFPDFVSRTQIDRLDRLLEDADEAGLHYSEQALTDFLRSKNSWEDFEQCLEDLDRSLSRAREVHSEFNAAGKAAAGDSTVPAGRPATSTIRAQPGTASGGEKLPEITGQWFPEVRDTASQTAVAGTKDVRVAQIPGQIAKKLRKMAFKNFDDFRETFWKMVANDPALKQGWSASNLGKMEKGLAPRAPKSEVIGGRANSVYQLDHKLSLQNGGGLYDLDNIQVVGPDFHVKVGE